MPADSAQISSASSTTNRYWRRHRVRRTGCGSSCGATGSPSWPRRRFFFALVSGLVVSLGLYRQAEHDRDAADRAREGEERLVGGIVDLKASPGAAGPSGPSRRDRQAGAGVLREESTLGAGRAPPALPGPPGPGRALLPAGRRQHGPRNLSRGDSRSRGAQEFFYGRPLNVEGLAHVHKRVGEALAWKGETEAALKHYRKALAFFQELAPFPRRVISTGWRASLQPISGSGGC